MSASGIPVFMPMSYGQYLESPGWRAARAAALLRAGNRCALDASHTEDLHVVHNTRERLGEELDRDLTVLCASCRDAVHRLLPGHGEPDAELYAVATGRVPLGPAGNSGAEPALVPAAPVSADSVSAAAGVPPWPPRRPGRSRRSARSPLPA